jgi:hypothetical protein
MLRSEDVLAVVEADVRTCFEGTFAATTGFRLLSVPGFDFDLEHVPEADVSFVSWSWTGEHTRTLRCVEGTRVDGEPIQVIDTDPPVEADALDPMPSLAPTGRPVTIVGTTVVLSRDEEEEKEPTLIRFIDWASVFTQLGYAFDYALVVP